MNQLYREMDSYIQKCFFASCLMARFSPSLVLCDLLLPGIQVAAHAHNTPLVLFSAEPLHDYYPMRMRSISHQPLDDLVDSFHYTEMSVVVDDMVSFMNNFIASLHLPPQPPFLYSAPLLFFDGVSSLFPPSPFPRLLPSTWIPIGPAFRSGSADLSITGQILSFLHASQITTRVLLYVGDNAGFDVWQIKTIVGGLQDPSINVIILGTMNPRGIARKNVMIIDSSRVSPFHLLSTYSITAVISYCDALLVESALFSRIPLLCIPSRRNRVTIQTLQREQCCVVFPEGFWTESTVRDCLRQAMNIQQPAIEVEQWEKSREELRRMVESGELLERGKCVDDRSVEDALSHVVL